MNDKLLAKKLDYKKITMFPPKNTIRKRIQQFLICNFK